jgi:hypothetical protein
VGGHTLCSSHDPAHFTEEVNSFKRPALFIGIHNAWDAVTYIARGRMQQPEESGHQPSAAGEGADSSRRTPGS